MFWRGTAWRSLKQKQENHLHKEKRVPTDIYTSRYRHLFIFGWRNPTLQWCVHRARVSLFVFPQGNRKGLHPPSAPAGSHRSSDNTACNRGAVQSACGCVQLQLPAWGGTYLLGAEFRVALPHFAWTPFDDCIAEHSNDHDEEEVAGVHQVQVDEGAVVLHVWKQQIQAKSDIWVKLELFIQHLTSDLGYKG